MKKIFEVVMVFFRIILIFALFSTFCNNFEVLKNDNEIITENSVKNLSTFSLSSQEKISELYAKIQDVNFSIRVYPVNTQIFDEEDDKIYKYAFFNVIHNIDLIKNRDGQETYHFIDGFRGNWRNDEDAEEYFEKMLRNMDYYYFDFDGDGLPELTTYLNELLLVLKYYPDKEQVYSIAARSDYSHLLGSRQIYDYMPNSANRICYGYELLREDGTTEKSISFEINYNDDEPAYFISVYEHNSSGRLIDDSLGSPDYIVSEEDWNVLTKDFFAAIDNPIQPQSYSDIFGDIEKTKNAYSVAADKIETVY